MSLCWIAETMAGPLGTKIGLQHEHQRSTARWRRTACLCACPCADAQTGSNQQPAPGRCGFGVFARRHRHAQRVAVQTATRRALVPPRRRACRPLSQPLIDMALDGHGAARPDFCRSAWKTGSDALLVHSLSRWGEIRFNDDPPLQTPSLEQTRVSCRGPTAGNGAPRFRRSLVGDQRHQNCVRTLIRAENAAVGEHKRRRRPCRCRNALHFNSDGKPNPLKLLSGTLFADRRIIALACIWMVL